MSGILAIDQSTSATKALLFDTEGNLLDQNVLGTPPVLSAARLGRT